jgi:hypothetical protein
MSITVLGHNGEPIGAISLTDDYLKMIIDELPPRLLFGYSWNDRGTYRELGCFQLLREPAEEADERITVTNFQGDFVANVPTGKDVYVAVLNPNGDGSGSNKVLGVYEKIVEAEARCYRSIKETGGQPTEVVTCQIGSDAPGGDTYTTRLYEEAIKAMNDYNLKCDGEHTIVRDYRDNYLLQCNGVTFATLDDKTALFTNEIDAWRHQQMEIHNEIYAKNSSRA